MKVLEIIFIIFINFNIFKCQQSCSNIANYFFDYYGTYGRVEIPHVPLKHTISFEIELYVSERLTSSNDWKIFILNKNMYDDLLNNRNIILKFIPIITNPLPIVSGVLLNGNRICFTPPARGRYVFPFKLSYACTINNLPQNIATNSNTRRNQNPFWYYRNQGATTITCKQPPKTPTQPPITTSSRPAPPRQTQVSVNNKLGNENNDESYVCGIRRTQQSASPFIIGGEGAKKYDFPWLTALHYRENGFICGGTLVSTKIIVTAAHCIKDKKSIETRSSQHSTFYLGKYTLKDLGETDFISAGVKTFIIHPSWNSIEEPYTGDLAIALIYKTINFTNNIIPLCMPPQKQNHEDLIGKVGLVAGWGITDTGTTSNIPRFVMLPVVDDAKCLRSNEVFTKITSSSTFCVGDGSGRSPCNGDSGGAFAVKNDADSRYYFRGIVSSGVRSSTFTCDNSKYAIFTDVAQYTDWIQSYITMYG